ncbi:MAG: CPBP family intramembrane metalloprotease [Calothrix sp. FI2-JRJ7]|jgi:hypothetical protein|nr:CPBP family intramembrane metalloprotease [Calothrix sp. FI2-JRJ7]
MREENGADLSSRTHGTPNCSLLFGYVGLAFSWSWLCWGLSALSQGFSSALSHALQFIATFGPAIAAMVLTASHEGKPGVQQLLRKMTRWRVSFSWYAIAVGLPAVVLLLALLLHMALGGTLLLNPVVKRWWLVPANFLLILVLGGPLGEELGWRGFAFPLLYTKFSLFQSSLIVGIVWAVWHVPLFLIPNTVQRQLPFALFVISIIILSFLYSWLYNNTNQSVLLAILFHTAINSWPTVIPILPTSAGSLRPYIISIVLLGAISLMILIRESDKANNRDQQY